MTAADPEVKKSASLEGVHIAMVVRDFSPLGGLELYSYKLVEGLLEKGLKVTVVCQDEGAGLKHDRLSVVKVEGPPARASRADKIGHLYERFTRAVGKLESVDLVHSQHAPVRSPDVVTYHNHTIHRLSEVGFGWEKLLNSFKVNFRDDYRARNKMDRRLSEDARLRIFVSEILKRDYYKAFEIDEAAPWAIAFPGASLSLDDGLAGSPVAGNQSVSTFLFVGKGYRKKGLDVLLGACRLLKERRVDFRLRVAGLKTSSARRLNLMRLGIADRVEFLGFRRDMDRVFQDADALVLPSRVEPFGMAPIQAMAFGLPTIVSRCCGVSEVLSDGEDSLLLNDHLSCEELAGHMQRLLEDRDLYDRLSGQARKKSVDLDWSSTAEATLDAYRRLVSDQDARAVGSDSFVEC